MDRGCAAYTARTSAYALDASQTCVATISLMFSRSFWMWILIGPQESCHQGSWHASHAMKAFDHPDGMANSSKGAYAKSLSSWKLHLVALGMSLGQRKVHQLATGSRSRDTVVVTP